ncbi:lysylphosphatidylglycerol synthase transmembrane domain-containing protein [Kitasatospora camelliae]|uniref:Lysylphosphatidylglycerol synthase transmembrane domain-containing protein n=1 Tax=Kitasatospora camelliae TaxID=3156397 RepID=A0AAU8JWY0_9ACTN
MATVIQADESREAAPERPERADRRVRHPASLIRVLTGLATTGLVLLLADYAEGTAGGLDADVTLGAGMLPWPPVQLAGALCAAALLVVPLGFAVDRLVRGEGRRIPDGVLAAVAAYGLALGLDLAVGDLTALTHPSPDGPGHTDPVYGHLAPVIAFMTAVGLSGLRRWRTALTAALGLAALSGLITGYATPLSLVLALLVGWTTAQTVRYAVGEPTHTPTLRQIAHALAQAGVRPDAVRPTGRTRYLATQHEDGPDLDVHLLDRRAQANGLPHHLWQLLRLRTAPRPLGLRPLRAGAEHLALLAYAAAAAGVRTRRPAAVTEVGPEAMLVAYPHLAARPLGELADEELTDPLLVDAWRQLRLLQGRRIAHRGLGPESVLVDDAGQVHLAEPADGEIAAGDLLLRLDVAGLLTAVALRVGPERAVAAAMAVLGPAAVGAALPLLQPIALPRGTRAALKEQPGLPARIRAEVLLHLPQAPVEPVRLERLRPRVLVTLVAGILAGYLLLRYLFGSGSNPFALLAGADPLWLAGAVVAAAASYLAATLGFVGFVPERLSFGRALAAQLAGSFVKLVSPGGVGGVALNTRFLQSAGIPTAQALSSVGASQLIGLGLHLVQLALFGALLGLGPAAGSESKLPDPWVMGLALAGVGVLLLSVVAVPVLRRRVQTLLRPLRAEVLPRLLDLLQQPGKLAAGLAGQLLVSMAFVVCLYCCVQAVGRQPDFSAVAVTFLAGNAVGSAAPTPGGVGGVETVMTKMLASTGAMDEGAALAAVMLFRLLVFLLPVLPGWAAFAWLQRRKAL